MDWQDLGVLAAMVGVIGSFYLTWRGQRQDKDLSEATAARAEAAARLSTDNSERVVLALEAIAAKDFGGGPSPVLVAAHVRWSLVHHQGDTYRLENVGNASAYDVQVTAHETMIVRNLPDGVDLAPGEAAIFLAARSLATSDSTVTVTWASTTGGSDSSEWRYPLPPNR